MVQEIGQGHERLARHVQELEQELDRHRALLADAQEVLHAIYASSGWKVVVGYARLRDRLLPQRTRRRRLFQGLLRTAGRLCRRLPVPAGGPPPHPSTEDYARWIAQNEPCTEELERQRRSRFAWEPRIRLLVPLADPEERLLRAMLQSVADQTYGNWELCLLTPQSLDASVRQLLEGRARQDGRICLVATPAEAEGSGEFVALLGQHDLLSPSALFAVVRSMNQFPDVDVLYSDEDVLDGPCGQRRQPHFKPDWSPDTLRSHHYVGRLAVFRGALLDQIGGLGLDGGDYDRILRASERARRIVHLPYVLYHRRRPAAADPSETAALAAHLRRVGVAGEIQGGARPGLHRVSYPLPARPLVSLLIPSRDQPELLKRCVESIRRSHYDRYEVLVIENGSRRPETFICYEELSRAANVRILTWDRPFNYAAVNNHAAARAAGEVLLFLNNDVQAINPDWLERLLEHALRPEVGCVGAKLYYPDHTVQHAGVVLAGPQHALHVHAGSPRDADGYAHRLVTVRNVSAVTGACLMTRCSVFEEVGGFDEDFVIAYNDLDLCLRIRQRGYRIVWTPHAELYHFEFATRGRDDTPDGQLRGLRERGLFRWKWGALLRRGDPYYSPNLVQDRPDCSLNMRGEVP